MNHALNKVYFGAKVVEVVLKGFLVDHMSLSVMVQCFPTCKKETVVDIRQKAAVLARREPETALRYLGSEDLGYEVAANPVGPTSHVWHEEKLWSCRPGHDEKIGSRIPEVGEAGDPRAEQVERAKKRRRADPYFRRERELDVSDVSDEEDADVKVKRIRDAKAAAVQRGVVSEAHHPG